MSVLLAVYVIYLAFDIFQTGWLQFDFHVQWNRRLVLTALEAGIAEETLCRFGILGALLYACRNLTQRVPIAASAPENVRFPFCRRPRRIRRF